MEWV